MPTPSLRTELHAAGAGFFAHAPDVAFDPIDGHWYAVIETFDATSNFFRVVRSVEPGNLLGDWSIVIDKIRPSFADVELINNPAFARNVDSTIYRDAEGWSYLFFGSGEDFPDFNTWALRQIRFRVDVPDWFAYDGFLNHAPFREASAALGGTIMEFGDRTWADSGNVVLHDGRAVLSGDGPGIAGVPVDIGSLGHSISVEGIVEPLSSWIGIGFSESATGGYFGDGQLWLLLTPEGIATVYADGTTHQLVTGAAPGFTQGLNSIKVSYDPVAGTVSAWVNRQLFLEEFSLASISFTPNISHIGFHMNLPATEMGEASSIDTFVARDGEIFFDGFESGDLVAWDI